MREDPGMRRRDNVTRLLAVFLTIGSITPAVLARDTPLRALREWMLNTEEAATYLQKRDYAKAEERLNLAINEIRPYLPDSRRIMARSYCELARVLYHQKRYADAEPLARWALMVRESDNRAKPDSVFQCYYTLALIQSALKNHGEAEQLLARSLALQEKNLGRDHINSIIILNQLATVYVDQAKYSEAERVYLRSIAIHERKTPDLNLDLAATAEQYCALLRLMKRYDEAEKWHARALTIRDNVATRATRAQADEVAREFRGYR
jgi:tetratricopeptide (TPR) repeat protein